MRASFVVACAVTLGVGASSALGVSVYFQEDFNGVDPLGGWSGGATYNNPGTGGVGGAGDGYLRVSRPSPSSLAARTTTGDYIGDLTAAGITGLTLYLNDVGTNQNLNLFVGFGNTTNFWQYNFGFQPPENQWAQFSVDFTDPSKWNLIGSGPGTFQEALQNCDRILVRHDQFPGSPTGTQPVPIAGDFGIDRVQFVPAPGAAGLASIGLIALLRRRRA